MSNNTAATLQLVHSAAVYTFCVRLLRKIYGAPGVSYGCMFRCHLFWGNSSPLGTSACTTGGVTQDLAHHALSVVLALILLVQQLDGCDFSTRTPYITAVVLLRGNLNKCIVQRYSYSYQVEVSQRMMMRLRMPVTTAVQQAVVRLRTYDAFTRTGGSREEALPPPVHHFMCIFFIQPVMTTL